MSAYSNSGQKLEDLWVSVGSANKHLAKPAQLCYHSRSRVVLGDFNLVIALTSAASGTILAQTFAGADPLVERLGVAGFIVVTLLFIIRYFMGVVDKKDMQIKELVEGQVRLSDRNALALIQTIDKNHEVNGRTAEALNRLSAILEQRPMR